MDTLQQDQFLNDFDLIQIHPKVHQRHIDFLKTVDPDNQSKAIRLILDEQMKRKKMQRFQDSIMYIILGLCFAMFALIILTMF